MSGETEREGRLGEIPVTVDILTQECHLFHSLGVGCKGGGKREGIEGFL